MIDRMRPTRCTVQRHTGDFCDAPSAEDMPFPICGKHAAKLYRHIAQAMADVASDPLFMLHSATRQIADDRDRSYRTRAGGRPTVYYVQVGEYIKIGYTSQLQKRMLHYPPNKRLLATEPGDERLERERHEQFGDLRAFANEWFQGGPKLFAHINELRTKAGSEIIDFGALS